MYDAILEARTVCTYVYVAYTKDNKGFYLFLSTFIRFHELISYCYDSEYLRHIDNSNIQSRTNINFVRIKK